MKREFGNMELLKNINAKKYYFKLDDRQIYTSNGSGLWSLQQIVDWFGGTDDTEEARFALTYVCQADYKAMYLKRLLDHLLANHEPTLKNGAWTDFKVKDLEIVFFMDTLVPTFNHESFDYELHKGLLIDLGFTEEYREME